jgi:effector-binding domain-containing protein
VDYEINLRRIAPSPTAVVARTTTWDDYPRLWPTLLDQVYAFVRGGGALKAGHNVMLYKDDVPHVEVGVQVDGPFDAGDDVVPSHLPGGLVASTVHQGPYSGLIRAHNAVRAWCSVQGLEITGARWEIYGDWHEDESQLETEVCYLLDERWPAETAIT